MMFFTDEKFKTCGLYFYTRDCIKNYFYAIARLDSEEELSRCVNNDDNIRIRDFRIDRSYPSDVVITYQKYAPYRYDVWELSEVKEGRVRFDKK